MKIPCDTCNGSGYLLDLTQDDQEDVPCPECKGSGKVKSDE